MESSRTYTFRIIGILLLTFLFGILVGIGLYRVRKTWVVFARKPGKEVINADAVTMKRMQAINQAIKSGKTEYEFTVDSPEHLSR